MAGAFYCHQCGSPVPANARFCPRCGYAFDRDPLSRPAVAPGGPVSPMTGLPEPSLPGAVPPGSPPPAVAVALPLPPSAPTGPVTAPLLPLPPPPPPPPSPAIQFTGAMHHPSHRRVQLVHPHDHTRRDLAIGALIVAILFLVVVFVPFPAPFSGHFLSRPIGAPAGPSFTRHFDSYAVAGSWSVSLGQPITLRIQSASGVLVYEGNGSSGSFDFTADGEDYGFYATNPSFVPVIVSYSGTTSATVWESLTGT